MQINIKQLSDDAVVPIYATAGSACFDLVSTVNGIVNPDFIFGTGLAFEIPKGYVMLVFSRSGMGFKDGVRLANGVGVIDSDYRGEVKVKLVTDHNKKFYAKGERIAQALVVPYEQVEFRMVKELEHTERGEGGLGSTGQ